ncbi:MAG: AMP-binding protein [Pelomonas sp.]|nr:AMP-binding protein [Roseateles sp.]
MNLAHWLRLAAEQQPTSLAIANGKEHWCTYEDMSKFASAGAYWLRSMGLRPGDCVCLYMQNSPEYLVLMWSVWWAGMIVVPINARLHVKEAAWIAEHSCAKIMFCDEAIDSRLERELDTLAHYQCLVQRDLKFLRSAKSSLIEERSDEDTMWLFYTSGTTGRPKGVMLAPRQLRLMTMGFLTHVRNIDSGDCAIHPAPLSHGSGLYHLAYVLKGALNVIPTSKAFSEKEVFELTAHWGRASFFAAPTMIKRLVNHVRQVGKQPAGIDLIVYGGAPMYRADLMSAIEAIGPHFAQIYGQGECPMTITTLPRSWINDTTHPLWESRVSSVGFPHPMVELTIRDESNQPLPVGSIGEVCVRGDIVMNGYWRNHGATFTAIRDGWLHTGDIGVLSDHGFLSLIDRSKDSIISGGTNIFPREIEEALSEHPDVVEISVIGRPCDEWGERVVAYVVAAPGANAHDLSLRLDKFALDRIARFKRPRLYRFVDVLPKNAYGKILKSELRALEAQFNQGADPH